MKVPLECKLNEQDASVEWLGVIQTLEMTINKKIDFPLDTIKIVPSKGIKLNMWEVASYQAAIKLVNKDQIDTGRDFEHFAKREHILAKYIREAVSLAMSELSDKGNHVFTAYIDRPKGFKKKEIVKVEEEVDNMADLVNAELDAPIIEDEIEEVEVVKKATPAKKKKTTKKKVAPKKEIKAKEWWVIWATEVDAWYNSKMTSYLYKPTGKVKKGKMAVVKKPGRQYLSAGETVTSRVVKSKSWGWGFGRNPFK